VNKRQLTALFQKLGAPNAAEWASSQIEEGIPQLARFTFLRQAWRQVIEEDDKSWISSSIESSARAPDAPHAGIGHALKNLRALGATDEDLTNLARGMQAQLLFGLCYLIDDPGELEEEIEGLSWALVELDTEGAVLHQIGGLHESVLETDPTGREMRPKGSVR